MCDRGIHKSNYISHFLILIKSSRQHLKIDSLLLQASGQLKSPDNKKLGFPMRLDTNQTKDQGTKVQNMKMDMDYDLVIYGCGRHLRVWI